MSPFCRTNVSAAPARITLQSFRNDPIARRAAAYAIQTISEAVRRIPDDWLADFPTEPWSQIRQIGNRIRHEYFAVDDAIRWRLAAGEFQHRGEHVGHMHHLVGLDAGRARLFQALWEGGGPVV